MTNAEVEAIRERCRDWTETGKARLVADAEALLADRDRIAYMAAKMVDCGADTRVEKRAWRAVLDMLTGGEE